MIEHDSLNTDSYKKKINKWLILGIIMAALGIVIWVVIILSSGNSCDLTVSSISDDEAKIGLSLDSGAAGRPDFYLEHKAGNGDVGKPDSYIDTPQNEMGNREQTPLTSGKQENIFFYSRNDSNVQEYIIGKKGELLIVAGLEDNINTGIEIGVPISVRNSGLYYVPLFYEGRCIHIASILRTGEIYSMCSGKMFADVLSRLDPGNYYFEADIDNNVIYLKGNGTKIAIDGNFPQDYNNIGYNEKDIFPEIDEVSVDVFKSFLF